MAYCHSRAVEHPAAPGWRQRGDQGIWQKNHAEAAKGDAIHQRAVNQLQDAYRHRAEGFEAARKAYPDNPEAQYMARLISLECELIGIQRTTLIDLRDHDAISDDVLRQFQVLLDLEESQLEEEERRWSV